jgi:hypothetical protein
MSPLPGRSREYRPWDLSDRWERNTSVVIICIYGRNASRAVFSSEFSQALMGGYILGWVNDHIKA